MAAVVVVAYISLDIIFRVLVRFRPTLFHEIRDANIGHFERDESAHLDRDRQHG